MDNADVARLLNEVADLLEIEGENPFRVRAYRNAARTVEGLPEPVALIVASGVNALTELPGIGKDLAAKIFEIVGTGDLDLRRELRRKVPASVTSLMRVEGVGPKRAKLFFDQLGITTVDALLEAAETGRLHALHGIGELTEKRIRDGCAAARVRASRFPIAEADAHAEALLAYLREAGDVSASDAAGSLRRRRDTVGDIDLLVASGSPKAVADRFVGYPAVAKVLAKGETKSSVVLRSGMQVDLRVVPSACYGAALHYFTGSKSHNIAVRTLAAKLNLKVSEYGVFRGEERIAGGTEEEVFRAVGLPFIPPELREDRGEIDAALAGTLPKLVTVADLRGDLHVHTDASDGANSLSEMVEECVKRGYAYVAITDHTKAVRIAGGLDGKGFTQQRSAIDALRAKHPGIEILHGAEVDILKDGSLDLDEETLASLDLVIAAVHSHLTMKQEEMTERILRAMAHPRVNVLAHPTGRLLGQREPYALDTSQVIAAAKAHGVLLEINAQPSRLDLSDTAVRMAHDAGAMFVVNTDAHRTSDLSFARYGIDQARRGWCSAADVANTLPLPKLRRLLRRDASRRASLQSRHPAAGLSL